MGAAGCELAFTGSAAAITDFEKGFGSLARIAV
jgi:hypothetical protein